jgi:hypothetical protein
MGFHFLTGIPSFYFHNFSCEERNEINQLRFPERWFETDTVRVIFTATLRLAVPEP